jgi:uncharacterized protein
VKRAFLDANVLFSAAYRENAGLLRLWHLQDVELITSDYAVREAASNLPGAEHQRRLDGLVKRVKRDPQVSATSALPHGVILPEKDIPILQAAIGAGADVLLTGDVTHFGRYFRKRVGGVRVLQPADFLREMGA